MPSPDSKAFKKPTEQLPELQICVAGLVGHITLARQTLSGICRGLNDNTMPHVLLHSILLQNVINEAVELQGQECHIALKYVDRTITSMIDVVVSIDDIVHLVYQLQVQSPDPISAITNPSAFRFVHSSSVICTCFALSSSMLQLFPTS
ncbi:hypothetical protein POM88_034099 [Heracleum sosnowskyi]|uniref:Uncharacterized protein n=1 Tax=Heracleum sosnowskyi TaxID=360622 RepID=A0AAD8HKR9_9APIA|nr:hypothetical protein POM88_034099 [Heracleum sosnowskyi]